MKGLAWCLFFVSLPFDPDAAQTDPLPPSIKALG
jgi:hypothetical protein